MARFFYTSTRMFNKRLTPMFLTTGKLDGHHLTLLLFFFLFINKIFSQTTNNNQNYKTVIPGPQFEKGKLHQFLFGKNYRKEWTTKVKTEVFEINEIFGGLKPVEQIIERHTKTLRLKDKNGKFYVLRLVTKNFEGLLPADLNGTIVVNIANDQASNIHPFAAVVVPPLASAAGIAHTNSKIVFVPESETLGVYNKDFANTLCLFEEDYNYSQQDQTSFGNVQVVSTKKMLSEILNDNEHAVDQKAYVKARLFDMFLGDWVRPENNWSWQKQINGENILYTPIPINRDLVFTKIGGLVPYFATTPEDFEFIQPFDYKIKNVKKYNYTSRDLDRRLTNEISKETWLDVTKELQNALDDNVIEAAIKKMPAELFAISGEEIILKLKQRRNDLLQYAEKYYKFVNEVLSIVGTKEKEVFEINRLNDNETSIKVYDINNGQKEVSPFYSRILKHDEIDEVIVYGIEGDDVFNINGKTNEGLRIRIVGSTGKDSLVDHSFVSGPSEKTKFYDSEDHFISSSGETKTVFSNDTAINTYVYNSYRYNTGHTIKSPSFNNADDLYVSFGYTYQKQHWRVEPFGWEQTFKINYSISQNSISADYEGIFNEVIGNWNIVLNGRYDAENQINYFGLGNNSKMFGDDHRYHRIQTNEVLGRVGINRNFLKYNSFTISAFYNTIKILNEEKLFVSDILPLIDPDIFERKNFGGALIQYNFNRLNDPIVPTKGFTFSADASYTQNLKNNERSFTRLSGVITKYFSLSNKFSFLWKTGGATVNGEAEFYQLPWLGGGQNLKGYRRQRFYGNTSLFNNNELRWITNIRTKILNGKIGLVGFADAGRVWLNGETSDKWHFGYGAGFLIAPFNRVVGTVFFGKSKDDALIHLRVGRLIL